MNIETVAFVLTMAIALYAIVYGANEFMKE
jgi:hypothetical protein